MNKLLLDIYSSKSRAASKKLPSTFKTSLNKLINKSLDRNMNFNAKKNIFLMIKIGVNFMKIFWEK